ncbi:peroxisomal nicotinamide adenine dinucleotide carrier-like isoform X1 [Cucurbita maxima]|uniref:Peroxisomal nicotinamide adenine dinucleotide carrier-like isoform X1 n=1 Tax=Cucurbita maxima TaxID=3661 RepID=A0A6J1K0J5_CUCMA|nr:peroxisomal nicotinamide adenine dinucleotide carrier-like isoform X1 [Cucurbita maxima]XP_022995997.1 peroxisomal nicotinamide adenine dinucleotide carrier-like isoform X1 [Cucurbita maxima]
MSDALINGLAGAGGGVIAQLITYPLQTVNTRQQTERDVKNEKRKLGTLQLMCQVVKHEGWDRLYGGLGPSLVGTSVSQGVYYYFYQIFRSKAEAASLERMKAGIGDGSVGMLSSLLVAAVSGCVNVLLTNPIWVVVTRMQTHKKVSKPSLPGGAPLTPLDETVPAAVNPPSYRTTHAIQELYDEAGIRGFWKGVIPTLIMVSNPSIQFMLYETMLNKLKKQRALRKVGSGVTALEVTFTLTCNSHRHRVLTTSQHIWLLVQIFLLGALAKLGATVVTYPLLVVKARLQAKQVVAGDKRHQYKGTFDAIIKMIRYEGVYGFYKGMGTKIVQSVLAAAVLFMVKEELVRSTRFLLTKGAIGRANSKPQ